MKKVKKKSRQVRNFRETLLVVRLAARGLNRAGLPQMAAALSYRTIFSLIPIIVVALVMLRHFASDQDIAQILDRALDYTGIKEIAVDPAAGTGQEASRRAPRPGEGVVSPGEYGPPTPGMGPREPLPPLEPGGPGREVGRESGLDPPGVGGRPAGEPSVEQPGPGGMGQPEQAPGVSPEAPGEEPPALDEVIRGLVDRVQGISLQAIGFIGVVFLIYAAIAMLVEVERCFNRIYRAPTGRAWIRRVSMYWTLLTLGALFLLATFYLGDAFERWVTEVLTGAETAEEAGRPGWALRPLGFFITVIISTFLLSFIYIAVPTARVDPRTALAGAFIAAVLWELGKWGFTQYLSFSTGYARLYGVVALLPLFLLWVYVTWLIVLFGLQVSYGLQMFGTWRDQIEGNQDRLDFVDPAAVVPVMVVAAEHFSKGKPVDPTTVSERTGLPGSLASRILSRMVEAGHLHRVEAGDEEDRYALSHGPEDIMLGQLVAIGQSLADDGGDDGRSSEVLQRVHKAQCDAVADVTLAEAAGLRKGGGKAEAPRAEPEPA